ncbi:MAG: AI-2E family transporter [Acidobacteriota bacterium]
MTSPTTELPRSSEEPRPTQEGSTPEGVVREDVGPRDQSTEIREPVRAQAAGRGLLVAASAIVVLAGLKAATTIIIPFLLAFFLACVTLPLLNFLTKRRVPTGLAVGITIVAVLAALSGVGFLVSGSVSELRRELPKYRDRVDLLSQNVEEATRPAIVWLREHGVDVPPQFGGADPEADPETGSDGLEEAVDDLTRAVRAGSPAEEASIGEPEAGAAWFVDLLDVDAVIDQSVRAISAVATAVSNTLVVVLILTFILLEASAFPRKLRVAFRGVGAERGFGNMMSELRRYLAIKTVISLATGSLIAAWLALLGVDFALLWGFVAFGLNFIPNLGSIIAAIPTTLLAILQLGFFYAVLVAIGYLVVNMVLGNLVEPLLLGRRLGLSALVVLLSLVFWGWLWGPVGMLLSVPLTLIVKLMLEKSQEFQWVAVLLGDEASALRQKAETGALRVARNRRS